MRLVDVDCIWVTQIDLDRFAEQAVLTCKIAYLKVKVLDCGGSKAERVQAVYVILQVT